MSWECNRLIWSSASLAMSSPLLCADNETWSVHTRCALLLLSGGQTSLWVLHHHNQWQVEPAGVWRPLHKHCLFYFSMAMELKKKDCHPVVLVKVSIGTCLFVVLFIYLFVYSALELWDLLLCICQGHYYSPQQSLIFLVPGLQNLQSAVQCKPAVLINYIKTPDGLN